MARMQSVAFIGMGIMGVPIAGHLLDAGYRLTVHAGAKREAQGLLDRDARWAETPSEAAHGANVVFTMISSPREMEEVYLSQAGLVRTCRRGTWLVDLGTTSPQLARDIHAAAAARGVRALDCPVMGGEQEALDGTLTLTLGCTEEEAKPLLPLLRLFSARRMYFDEPGGAQVAKLCNQVALAANMVGYAEALAIAEQEGLDQSRVRELVLAGMGASAAMEHLAPLSIDGDYRAGLRAEDLLKDLGLACGEADVLELSLPGTQNAQALYRMLCEVGGAKLGGQAVSLLYQDEAACVAAGLDWSLLPED